MPALRAPPAGNNGYYDVGAKISVTFGATDSGIGMGTVTAKLDGSTTLTSGGLINLDTLGVGAHTIVVTATDALGNVSSQTITFQIHATVTGLINAVNEGASRGLITASEAAVLVSELQSALKGNSGKTKISQSLSMVQSASGGSINAAYAALLIAWANDPLLTFK